MELSDNAIYLNLKEGSQNTLYILVGPPSIGKSTWTKNNTPNAFVISRDDIVDEVSSEIGLTYDDMFKQPDKSLPIGHSDPKFGTVIERPDYLPKFLPNKIWDKVTKGNGDVHKRFMRRIQDAKTSNQDIVVDMTNMNSKSRKNMLRHFKDLSSYRKHVVDFNSEGDDVKSAIKEISRQRAKELAEQGKSKNISDEVFDKMFSSYGKPSLREGFDEMTNIDDRERILDQANKLRGIV